MTFSRRHFLWALPLFVLALVLLLGMVADSWLESSGGRQMLETELSKSLGLPVRLRGDYSLRLFPRLEIAGADLELGQSGVPDVLASITEYSAIIELGPLVHREVKITSIRLHGGFVDLDHWPIRVEAEHEQAGLDTALPQVASIEIDDFSLLMQRQEKRILIERWHLTGFRQGHESMLDLQARLMDGKSAVARMKVQGGLTLAAGSLPVRLNIHSMSLDWGGSAIEGLSGQWEWDQPAADLAGQMRWDQPPNTADLRLELTLGPEPSGSLFARYQGLRLPEPASLAVDFLVQPDTAELKHLEMQIVGQSLGGDGCLMLTDKASLRLWLEADTLDLDRIYSLDFKPAGEGAELALELAVVLHIQKAWFAGALADDVTVEVGPEPICPGPGPQE